MTSYGLVAPAQSFFWHLQIFSVFVELSDTQLSADGGQSALVVQRCTHTLSSG